MANKGTQQTPPQEHYKIAKRLSGYLSSLKRPWNFVVYDKETNRRAVGSALGEAYSKLLSNGPKPRKPIAIEHRAWEKMKKHD